MPFPSLPRLLAFILAGLAALVLIETASVRRHGYDLAGQDPVDSAEHSATVTW